MRKIFTLLFTCATTLCAMGQGRVLPTTFSPESGSTVDRLQTVTVTYDGPEEMNQVGYYNFQARMYGLEEISVSSRPYLMDDEGKVAYKAARVMWPLNPDYKNDYYYDGARPRAASRANTTDYYLYNQYDLTFDGVKAGHYTLVIPSNYILYYIGNDLYGAPQVTAEYTVKEDNPATLGQYACTFSPAEGSYTKEFGIVTLYTNEWLYAYNNSTDLSYFNYFYCESARRPYVIYPDGMEQQVTYVDDISPLGMDGSVFQLTFTKSYTEGDYTIVIPDDFFVRGTMVDKAYVAYACPERRFTFHVGPVPEGIAAPTESPVPTKSYDIWGRQRGAAQTGISITDGRKMMKR